MSTPADKAERIARPAECNERSQQIAAIEQRIQDRSESIEFLRLYLDNPRKRRAPYSPDLAHAGIAQHQRAIRRDSERLAELRRSA